MGKEGEIVIKIKTQYIGIFKLDNNFSSGEYALEEPIPIYSIPFIGKGLSMVAKYEFYRNRVISDITDNLANIRTIKFEYKLQDIKL